MSQLPTSLATPQQGADFEPLRFYDSASVAIAQILEDEASFSSIYDTFLSSNSLSPQQRTRLADSLTGGDENPLVKTMFGIVTNPFVWLNFVATPAGATAIRSGLSMRSMGKQFSAYTQKHLPWIHSLGLSSPITRFADTAAQSSALNVTRIIEKLNDESSKTVYNAQRQMLERLQAQNSKLKFHHGYDLSRYAKTSEEFKALQSVEDDLFAYANRFDEAIQTTQYKPVFEEVNGVRSLKVDALGKPIFKERILRRKAMIEGTQAVADFQRRIKDNGVIDLANAYSKARVTRQVLLLGDDIKWHFNGKFELDPLKVEKLLGAIRNPTVTGRGSNAAYAHTQDTITQLLGDDVVRLIDETQEISTDNLMRIVDHALFQGQIERTGALSSRFMHRNITKPLGRVFDEANGTIRIEEPPVRDLGEGRFIPGSVQGTNRVVPRTRAGMIHSLEDIERFEQRFGSSAGLRDARAETYNIMRRSARTNRTYHYNEASLTDSTVRYMQESSRAYAMHVAPISDDVMRQIARDTEHIPENRLKNQLWKGGFRSGDRSSYVEFRGTTYKSVDELQKGLDTARRGGDTEAFNFFKSQIPLRYANNYYDGVSNAMVLEWVNQGLGSDSVGRHYRKTLQDVLVPSMQGRLQPRDAASIDALERAKMGLGAVADSRFGKSLEGMGGAPKQFVEELRRISQIEGDITGAGYGLSGAVAKYLYVTHLGINAGSVLLNMTQPFLLAGVMLDTPSMIKGYGDAITEMSSYMKARASRGAKLLDPIEKRQLIRKHFTFADDIGIAEDITPDEILFRQGNLARPNNLGFVSEILLKPFEYSERMNRLITAHALKHQYMKAGRLTRIPSAKGQAQQVVFPQIRDLDTFRGDMQNLVMRTQFTAEPLNTPTILLTNPFFGNPLIRQFSTFPLNSFVGSVYEAPRVGEAGGTYAKRLFNTFARGIGISAVVYEVGKGLYDADLSRGLFLSASTDILGGERLFESEGDIIQLPPAISIPTDFVRGFLNDDYNLVAGSIARTIPGGVALRRLANTLPQVPAAADPLNIVRKLQTQYADYNNPLPDGSVPLYNNQNQLIGYEPGTNIILRGLGADLGRFRQQGELDGYLLKQREEIVGARRQMLNALASNDIRRANIIRTRFQKKYGIPLTASETQMEAFLRMREATRSERIFDQLPSEARPSFQRMVEPQAESAQSLSGSRSQRERPAETQEPIDRLRDSIMQELQRMQPQSQQGFAPFNPFTPQ